MKKILFIFIALIAIVGCEPMEQKSNADMEVQAQTELQMQEANREVGMPNIVNFQEKKLAKRIYELRDQADFICYAYYLDLNGGKHFLGKCIGYGLPYSTQFSNPEKLGSLDAGQYDARNPYTMPQPEPNGLFMPDGLSATWLLLINPKTNKAEPIYIEPEIIVSPFKLH